MATSMGSQRLRNDRIVQNFNLVWLDGNINETNDDYLNFVMKLQQVVNTVNAFVNVDRFIGFINGIKEEKAFIISSGALA